MIYPPRPAQPLIPLRNESKFMETSFDRIESMVEWRFEPNRIVGRIKTRNFETEREVKIRIAGFPQRERARARENAQLSIALEIIKDLYVEQLYPTKQLSSSNPLADDDKTEKPRAGRGRPRKKRDEQKPEDGD